MAEPSSGTVTFLFTDIEGSTRLLKQLREQYGDVLAQHQRILRTVFEQAGGQVIDTQGDAFFVAFKTPKSAVAAAVAGQRGLADARWPDGIELRVRMGIHTGDATLVDNRYLGLAVHRAARICASASGGHILISQTTQNLLEDEEEELGELTFRDLGEQRLKDLDRQIRLFQLLAPGLPDERAVLEPADGDVAAARPFAGRESELAAAAQSAVGPSRRLPWARPLVLVPAAALVLGAAAVAAVALGDRKDGPAAAPRLTARSLAKVDPRTNRIVDVLQIGTAPSAIAAAGPALWVLSDVGETLTYVNTRTRETSTVGGLVAPCALAGDGRGGVWVVSNCQDTPRPRRGTITLAHAGGRRHEVDRKIRIRGLGGAIAVGAGSLWIADPAPSRLGRHYVDRIDLRTGKVSRRFPVGDTPTDVLVGEDAVWVTNFYGNSISRISLVTGQVKEVPVGYGPSALAAGGGGLWMTLEGDQAVWKLEPSGVKPTTTVAYPGGYPHDIAAGDTSVWVVAGSGRTLAHIDARSGGIVKLFRFPAEVFPNAVALAGGDVWVGVAPTD